MVRTDSRTIVARHTHSGSQHPHAAALTRSWVPRDAWKSLRARLVAELQAKEVRGARQVCIAETALRRIDGREEWKCHGGLSTMGIGVSGALRRDIVRCLPWVAGDGATFRHTLVLGLAGCSATHTNWMDHPAREKPAIERGLVVAVVWHAATPPTSSRRNQLVKTLEKLPSFWKMVDAFEADHFGRELAALWEAQLQAAPNDGPKMVSKALKTRYQLDLDLVRQTQALRDEHTWLLDQLAERKCVELYSDQIKPAPTVSSGPPETPSHA